MEKDMDKLTQKDIISIEEYELISEIIKTRLEKNITQNKLSKLTGISQPNIARFEKNIHSASLSTILRILNALGYKLKIEKNNQEK